jgi:metal-responsive CopG/Arc/MetJ family transcriptional regulator
MQNQRINFNGKSEMFNFRLSKDELKQLDAIAKIHQVSKSEFVRQAIISILKYTQNEK